MTPEERGRKATEILENPVFQEAVEGALKGIQNAWLLETDQEKRDGLWHKAQAIEAVAGELRKLRDNGVVARHRQERKK